MVWYFVWLTAVFTAPLTGGWSLALALVLHLLSAWAEHKQKSAARQEEVQRDAKAQQVALERFVDTDSNRLKVCEYISEFETEARRKGDQNLSLMISRLSTRVHQAAGVHIVEQYILAKVRTAHDHGWLECGKLIDGLRDRDLSSWWYLDDAGRPIAVNITWVEAETPPDVFDREFYLRARGVTAILDQSGAGVVARSRVEYMGSDRSEARSLSVIESGEVLVPQAVRSTFERLRVAGARQ